MAARMTVVGDYKGGNLRQAGKDLNYIEAQAAGFSKSFMSGFAGIGASIGGLIALQSVVSFFKDSAAAAMEDQKSMIALATAMDNVGLSAQNAKAEGLIESMMMQYGIADDQLRPAYQKLVTATQDVGKAQGLLQTALDLSAAGYGDLESASKALSAAAMGNFTALQRLKVPIDANIIKAKDFQGAIEALNGVVGGQAAAAAQTYAGQMSRLSVAFGEAQEALGYGFFDALNKSADGTDNLMTAISNLEPSLRFLGSNLGDNVRGLGTIVTALNGAVDAFDTLASHIGLSNGSLKEFLGLIMRSPLGIFADGVDKLRTTLSGTDQATRSYTSATVSSALAAEKAGGAITDLTADVEASGEKAYEAAKSFQDFWKSAANLSNQQKTFRDLMNTSGTVGSELFKAALEDQAKAADEAAKKTADAAKKVDGLGSSAGGAGAKAEELAIKWRAAAESITADVEGLKVTMGGGGEVIAGGLVTAFQNRLGAFKQIVSEQVGIVQQGRQALDSYAQSITDTIMGKINFSTVDPTTNQPLSPEQIVQMMLGDISNQQNAVTAIAGIAQQLPPALTQQIMALPPDAAIALANYLAANPAMLEQLTLAYQALADFTEITLGVPMAKAFATVGGKSATSMIADAKKTINDEAAAFQDFVMSKLSSKVKVQVVWESSRWDPEGRAVGGSVTGGTPYIVGERGPELFVPDASGSIIPNSGLPMAGGSAVGGSVVNINVTAGVGDPRAIGKSVVEAITLFERSSGPVFARA